jgi:hypothetical protein
MNRRLVVLVLTRQGLWDQGVRFGITDPFKKQHFVLINPGLSGLTARQILDRMLRGGQPGLRPWRQQPNGLLQEPCISPLRCMPARGSGRPCWERLSRVGKAVRPGAAGGPTEAPAVVHPRR